MSFEQSKDAFLSDVGAIWEPISSVHRLERTGELSVVGRHHMGVDPKRDAYVRVAEALRDSFHGVAA